MAFPWDDSRRAFTDAAEWFVRTAALVGDRWSEPGLLLIAENDQTVVVQPCQ